MQEKSKYRFTILYLFTIGLWLPASMAHGQKVTPKDSLQVVSLFMKSNAAPDPQLALKYADSMVYYATKSKFSRGIAWGNKQKALLYSRMKQTDKAIFYIDNAITFAARGRHYQELINELLFSSQIRNAYAFYDRAFLDVTKAIDIAKKINDPVLLGRSYTQLGRCYKAKEDFKKALEYDEKALALFKKFHSVPDFRETLTAMAVANVDNKNYEKGLAQLKEVENYEPSVPMSPFRLPELYGNIGWCYDSMGKEELAIQYYQKALEVTGQLGENMLATEVVIKDNLGALYTSQGKYDLAEKCLTEALAGAMKVKTPDEFRTIYEHLSQLSFLKKDYKKAYDYQEKQLAYTDSVMNNEKMEALESLSVKFQTREVEDKNKLLQKENALQKAQAAQEKAHKSAILYASIAIVLLLLIAILFGYYHFRQKSILTANKNHELRQKLLITQMNPHFIFNSIDNIQSLIHNKQDKEAINYLAKFSKLTRQILENSTESYITLEEELEMIRNYIGIQQLLYNNKFNFNITVDPSIDAAGLLIPPMLTQPFIENAIKHGFKSKAANGHIEIHFRLENQNLIFEITDNGTGFENGKKSDNKSLAMKITKERLVNLSKSKSADIRQQNLTDSENKTIGARVFFEMPYIYEN